MAAGAAGGGGEHAGRDARDRPVDLLPRWLALVGLGAIATWVFVDRLAFLTSSPYPMGVDGYWYAVQLRALLDSGHLYYASPPLALWLLAPLAAAAGPIAGAKLGAALAAAALPVAVYALARRVARDRAVGLFAATLAATSAGAFYLPTEFVKSAVALPIAAAALAALGWFLDRPGWRRAAAPLSLAAAAAACHPLGLAFTLAGAAAPLAIAWLEGARRRRDLAAARAGSGDAGPDIRRDGPARAARSVAVAVAIAAAMLAAVALAGRAAIAGAASRLLTADADWSIPAVDLGGRALHFRGEPAASGLAAVAALALALLGRRLPALRPDAPARDRAFALGPALWAIAVALPWLDAGDPEGLTFRLRALAFLPLSLLAAAVAAAALAPLAPSRRLLAVMFATGLLLVRPRHYEAPVVRVDPDLAAAVASARAALRPGAVVIAPERHIVFMATWYTGAPARLRPDPVPPSRRARLIPGSYMTRELAGALDEARATRIAPAPISLHRSDPDGLVLVAEPTWEWLLARLPAAQRDEYRAWPVH